MEKNLEIKKKPVDIIENTLLFGRRTSLIERLFSGECEWCGVETTSLESIIFTEGSRILQRFVIL